MNPSEFCSDAVFVRRAYLDLLGILPTAEEARAFMNQSARSSRRKEAHFSKSEIGNRKSEISKRARLIDRLLERPEFADFWALKWADLLRVEAQSLDQKGVQNFHNWIRRSLDEIKLKEQFVHETIPGRAI